MSTARRKGKREEEGEKRRVRTDEGREREMMSIARKGEKRIGDRGWRMTERERELRRERERESIEFKSYTTSRGRGSIRALNQRLASVAFSSLHVLLCGLEAFRGRDASTECYFYSLCSFLSIKLISVGRKTVAFGTAVEHCILLHAFR